MVHQELFKINILTRLTCLRLHQYYCNGRIMNVFVHCSLFILEYALLFFLSFYGILEEWKREFSYKIRNESKNTTTTQTEFLVLHSMFFKNIFVNFYWFYFSITIVKINYQIVKFIDEVLELFDWRHKWDLLFHTVCYTIHRL